MRISDDQIRKVLHESGIAAEISAVGRERDEALKLADERLIRDVTKAVSAMPDREETIADLKSRIEAGTYNPTGDEIADSMIRRTIADRLR